MVPVNAYLVFPTTLWLHGIHSLVFSHHHGNRCVFCCKFLSIVYDVCVCVREGGGEQEWHAFTGSLLHPMMITILHPNIESPWLYLVYVTGIATWQLEFQRICLQKVAEMPDAILCTIFYCNWCRNQSFYVTFTSTFSYTSPSCLNTHVKIISYCLC